MASFYKDVCWCKCKTNIVINISLYPQRDIHLQCCKIKRHLQIGCLHFQSPLLDLQERKAAIVDHLFKRLADEKPVYCRL